MAVRARRRLDRRVLRLRRRLAGQRADRHRHVVDRPTCPTDEHRRAAPPVVLSITHGHVRRLQRPATAPAQRRSASPLAAIGAIPDLSRSTGLGVVELVIAGLLGLVTVAALTGRYRLVPAPADDGAYPAIEPQRDTADVAAAAAFAPPDPRRSLTVRRSVRYRRSRVRRLNDRHSDIVERRRSSRRTQSSTGRTPRC